ncbi:Pyruvate/2-oxoacid:ferredoxin oxidoreductase gamma subunit, partial [Sporomusaceae bacterium BoRhaA]
HYPKVVKPDLLLAMTQEALDKYAHDLPDEAMLVIDTTFVKDIPNKFTNVYQLPITEKAKEVLGRALFANIIAIGAIVALTKAVSKESAV